jgi:hypothetical protein
MEQLWTVLRFFEMREPLRPLVSWSVVSAALPRWQRDDGAEFFLTLLLLAFSAVSKQDQVWDYHARSLDLSNVEQRVPQAVSYALVKHL